MIIHPSGLGTGPFLDNHPRTYERENLACCDRLIIKPLALPVQASKMLSET